MWPTDHAQAAAYLKNDLEMTRRVAEAIGIVELQIPQALLLKFNLPFYFSSRGRLDG